MVAHEARLPRTSVWWSANVPGGHLEESPEIEVVYIRLDAEADEVAYPAPGANAFTDTDQWFMTNGLEPDDPGCWQGTATYEGTSLTYVYEIN